MSAAESRIAQAALVLYSETVTDTVLCVTEFPLSYHRLQALERACSSTWVIHRQVGLTASGVDHLTNYLYVISTMQDDLVAKLTQRPCHQVSLIEGPFCRTVSIIAELEEVLNFHLRMS